jgi:hypothetical protein
MINNIYFLYKFCIIGKLSRQEYQSQQWKDRSNTLRLF